jgi:hypothetical protein
VPITGLGVAPVRRRARLLGHRRVDALGEAEVEDLHVPVVGHEDVVGLEVAVHDAASVRRGEPARDLQRPVDGLLLRHGRGVEPAAQRLALEQLGHGVGDAVVPAEVVDREDVRMRERGDGLGLALEARERVGVGGQLRGEDLDGDVAVELRVAGAVDLAHPAGAERREDFVGPETGPGSQRHGGGAILVGFLERRDRWSVRSSGRR